MISIHISGVASKAKSKGKNINQQTMWVSPRGAARILLSVNLILLFGFSFVLLFILLENNVGLYDWLYNTTTKTRSIIAYSWFLAVGLSPVLAIVLSVCFGDEIRKTIEWKSSLTIFIIAGIPSLAFVGLGIAMHYML